MDRRPLKTREKTWPRHVAKFLLRLGLSPNQVSLLSVVFIALGVGTLLLFPRAWWAYLAAAAGIQLRLLCNLVDGLMAVEGGAKTPTGEIYNEVPDRLADATALVGVGYVSGYPWLGWLATALALMTAYVRAFGASLGHGQDFRGPGAKPHRMALLTLGCLLGMGEILTGLRGHCLALTLAIVALLTLITIGRRLCRIASRMRGA